MLFPGFKIKMDKDQEPFKGKTLELYPSLQRNPGFKIKMDKDQELFKGKTLELYPSLQRNPGRAFNRKLLKSNPTQTDKGQEKPSYLGANFE